MKKKSGSLHTFKRKPEHLDNKLNLVSTVWTGPNVQWKLVDTGDGTHYRIEHKSSGRWLSSFPFGANFSLQPKTVTDGKTKWVLEN
ncbi:hypothetical protein D3C73_755180 [compost metagenome]